MRFTATFPIIVSLRASTCAVVLAIAAPAMAQNIPSPEAQEVIIKTSLMTFNDANLSGNYTVLNALGSKPFRETLSPEKLKAGFKEFNDKQIDIGPLVADQARRHQADDQSTTTA